MTHHTTTARSIDAQRLANISSFGSPNVVFRGDLESSSPDACFRLEGEFNGSINFPEGGIVHIAQGARFQGGSIKADLIYIEGQISGDIHARRAVEIASSAVVLGTVSYDGELDIHKNARIRGALDYTGEMTIDALPDATAELALNKAVVESSLAPGEQTTESFTQNVVTLVPAIAGNAANAETAAHSFEATMRTWPEGHDSGDSAFLPAAQVG